jgi:ethanolamine permease
VVVDATGGSSSPAGAIVLNIAIWGAVLSYLLQMVAYVVLRIRFPNASRPYRSPVGIPGAVIAGIIAFATFIGFLLIPTFLPAIVAIAVVFVVGLILFALIGRHRLVLSPEEEYALSGGQHGDPQKEGYDAMEGEVFGTDAEK